MFSRSNSGAGLWLGWPVIGLVVLAALGAIQYVRVNRPRVEQPIEAPRVYTQKGPLVNGQIAVPANEHYSNKIDLNRRSRIVGTFKTASLRTNIITLVLDEREYENWKAGIEHKAVLETGNIPGGKIDRVLEPAVYYLILDNRTSSTPQNVFVDFSLE